MLHLAHAAPCTFADVGARGCVQVALTVQDGQFYGTDGKPVSFKGLNWFGFETSEQPPLTSTCDIIIKSVVMAGMYASGDTCWIYHLH